MQLSATIGSERHGVAISGTAPLVESADAALAAFLLAAMRRGQPLAVDGDVSAELLDAVPAIQVIASSWWPELGPVDVRAERRARPLSPSGGTVSFFSGGVDSFYTALRHGDRITHLVLVRGFDVFGPGKDELWERVAAAARRAAAALGKPLIELATDVRDVVRDPDWPIYHGAALATVGHALADVASTVLVAGTHSYGELFPWGSHPALDHLWSSENVRFVHDGAETGRLEKTRAIAQSDVALEHLRVCWRNPAGAYNCGECEKCVRTMVALRICGALERCATLPDTVDLAAVRRLRAPDPNEQAFVLDNLRAAEETDPELARALRHSLRMTRLAGVRRRMVR
jgi:hypothetical protein